MENMTITTLSYDHLTHYYKIIIICWLLFLCVLIHACSLLSYAGVDFKVKYVSVGGKKLKLAIWDTGNSKCVAISPFIYYFAVTVIYFITHKDLPVCVHMCIWLSSSVYFLAK
jgi:hypothetical protein